MIIGEKIKQLIDKSGFSVPEIAKKFNMSEQNLYQMLKKDSISTKHLLEFSKFIKVPVGYFFDKEGQDQARIGVGGRADGAGECVDCKVKDEKIAELQALLEKAEERENRLFDTIAHLQRMCNYPVQNKKAG